MRRCLCLFLLVLCSPCLALADSFVVRPDGLGSYPTIQAAINAAAEGDTVLLWSGVFQGEGNRNVSFLGKAIVVRSVVDNPDSCVIDCEGNGEEIRRGFIFELTEGPESVLRGVSIVNGSAHDASQGVEYGGAIYCDSASPTIANCSIADCSADMGGGIGVSDGSPAIVGCNVSNCYSERHGGGMYLENGPFYVTECSVRDCFAGRDGGGIAFYGLNQGVCELYQCELFNNDSCEKGGGVYANVGAAGADFVMSQCVLRYNCSGASGGGFALEGSATHSITIANSEITNNFAWVWGGGVASHGWQDTQWEITGCTILENVAPQGAGLWFQDRSTVYLHNCIIAFNLDGGAVRYPPGTTAEISCCDIYGNEGGDWVGPLWDFYGQSGNFSSDPFFCDRAAGDLHLWNYSPCNQYNCGLIGAYPIGCWDVQGVDPSEARLSAAGLGVFPNPVSGAARVLFSLPPGQYGEVRVFDSSGRLIRSLPAEAGSGAVSWDRKDRSGAPVSAGIYYARLSGARESLTRTLVVVK